MTTPSEQKPNPSSENTAATALNPGTNNNEPQFHIPEPLPGIKPATQEILHLAMPKAEIVGPVNQVAAIDAVVAPPLAAKSDDNVLSQPQKLS